VSRIKWAQAAGGAHAATTVGRTVEARANAARLRGEYS